MWQHKNWTVLSNSRTYSISYYYLDSHWPKLPQLRCFFFFFPPTLSHCSPRLEALSNQTYMWVCMCVHILIHCRRWAFWRCARIQSNHHVPTKTSSHRSCRQFHGESIPGASFQTFSFGPSLWKQICLLPFKNNSYTSVLTLPPSLHASSTSFCSAVLPPVQA